MFYLVVALVYIAAYATLTKGVLQTLKLFFGRPPHYRRFYMLFNAAWPLTLIPLLITHVSLVALVINKKDWCDFEGVSETDATKLRANCMPYSAYFKRKELKCSNP